MKDTCPKCGSPMVKDPEPNCPKCHPISENQSWYEMAKRYGLNGQTGGRHE